MNTQSTPEKPTEHHLEENSNDDLKPGELVLDAAAKGQATSGYESLTAWETVKTFKWAAATCFGAAFSAATDGYQIGMDSSIVANKGFVHQFATEMDPNGDPYLASPILSSWGALMSVGQVVGTASIPFISTRYGRKIAMWWLWIILVTSVLARNWKIWLVGKILAGVGVGSLQATLPAYIAELAPTRIRGGSLMLYPLWWTLGVFFANIALQNLNTTDPYNYLTPIYTQWAQIGVMFIIFCLLPESPVWCVTRGLEERAKRILRSLHGDVPDYDVDYQYNLIAIMIEHERSVAVEQRNERWYAIFRGTDGLRTIISSWSGISQQFIGLKLFSSFGTYFFQQAGIAKPFTVKCITSSIQIATVLCNILIADKFGRRIIACSAVTLSWAACVVVGILGLVPDTGAKTYVFIVFACFWNVGMVATGAASSSFNGEISSQRLRPYTSAFAVCITCVIGVIMDVLVPYMVNKHQWNWGLKTGWFYAGIGLPATIGMWLLIPETKGRSTAELDELFERKIKPWRFSEAETATQRLVKSE
ncbi:hypothetical protein ACHAPT_008813 [Fusarium lateritium]